MRWPISSPETRAATAATARAGPPISAVLIAPVMSLYSGFSGLAGLESLRLYDGGPGLATRRLAAWRRGLSTGAGEHRADTRAAGQPAAGGLRGGPRPGERGSGRDPRGRLAAADRRRQRDGGAPVRIGPGW